MRKRRKREGKSVGDADSSEQRRGRVRESASSGWGGLKKAAADYKFAHSPAERARAAAERGDTIFEYQAMVTRRGNGRDLSAIEAEGWSLD